MTVSTIISTSQRIAKDNAESQATFIIVIIVIIVVIIIVIIIDIIIILTIIIIIIKIIRQCYQSSMTIA
jgi:hypothetical protein